MLMRLLYPLADCIVAVSAGVADDLSKILKVPRSQIKVIYNPVVTTEMLVASRHRVTHPWFADGEPPVILGIGRLTHAKGFSTLIQAFAKIRKAHIPARLMILGEGNERDKLEKLVFELGIDSDVSLPGFQNNAYSFLRHASVFVLSSLWEGLPTVLIEALACGTPIISTDCHSGPREILEDGKWGILVPVADEDALVTAIQNSLATPQQPIPEIAWARFEQEEVLSKYLQLITSINYSKTS
jgi:glycosyltransferase involved in cell wall biosynthesis